MISPQMGHGLLIYKYQKVVLVRPATTAQIIRFSDLEFVAKTNAAFFVRKLSKSL